MYFPKGQKGNEDGAGWSRAVQRALFINIRRAGCLGSVEVNAPGYVEIVCGMGRVRKKFMGRESQSPGVELTGGKQEGVLWR